MDALDPKYYDYIRLRNLAWKKVRKIDFTWDDKAISAHLALSPDGRKCTSTTSSYSFKTSLGNIVRLVCSALLHLSLNRLLVKATNIILK